MELNFLQAYAFTLAIETAALLFLLRREYGAGLIAGNSIMANSLTLPLVWFAFPLLGLGYPIQIALSELFAFAAEAGAYFILFRKIGWKKAAGISLAANAASFLAGLAVSYLI